MNNIYTLSTAGSNIEAVPSGSGLKEKSQVQGWYISSTYKCDNLTYIYTSRNQIINVVISNNTSNVVINSNTSLVKKIFTMGIMAFKIFFQ